MDQKFVIAESSPRTKTIPVKFRFPVHVVNEREIAIEIPIIPGGVPFISPNLHTQKNLDLNGAELAEAMEAATETFIRRVMIIK